MTDTICPLIEMECKADKCGWWLPNGCSMRVLAQAVEYGTRIWIAKQVSAAPVRDPYQYDEKREYANEIGRRRI